MSRGEETLASFLLSGVNVTNHWNLHKKVKCALWHRVYHQINTPVWVNSCVAVRSLCLLPDQYEMLQHTQEQSPGTQRPLYHMVYLWVLHTSWHIQYTHTDTFSIHILTHSVNTRCKHSVKRIQCSIHTHIQIPRPPPRLCSVGEADSERDEPLSGFPFSEGWCVCMCER